jgi:hypothetical protein
MCYVGECISFSITILLVTKLSFETFLAEYKIKLRKSG